MMSNGLKPDIIIFDEADRGDYLEMDLLWKLSDKHYVKKRIFVWLVVIFSGPIFYSALIYIILKLTR